ncbi:thiamine pyrophosphate-dependent enzyme [Nocardiopsis sp. NPDC058789]|uniref:thiamine pyrophosphate-dependent enzyme n=1 Tax=Nocardiopsis TaxID=2013 RepID=UPI00366AA550
MSTTGPAPTDAARSAGHLIVAQLEHEGVRRVYGVPGESYLDVLDGLYDSAVTTVVTRHEGGAGFMALAEGRLTGLPGVAMVTRGPGAANAFVAVHTAYQDATPLLLFVGLIPVADRGREAFQEFDLTGWFGSTAKKVVTLDDPASAARVVSEAVHTARSGRPGPVVIGLPEDVIRVRVPGGTVVEPRTATTGRPSAEAVAEVVARVDRAERPVIVVGGESWTDATGAALTAWARERRIPVLADFRAYDAVPHRVPGEPSPYAGSLGYGRADAAAALFDGADLALFVGTARTDVLSDGYTLGGDAETILVLPGDPLGHSGRVDQHLAAAPAGFVAALTEHGDEAVRHDADRMERARASHEAFSTPEPEGTADTEDGFVDLTAVMAVLREELDGDAVVTYGAGNHALWPARYLEHRSSGSLLAPRNGAMGMGVPAAVAASLVHPGRQVVSVAGDGCFLMNGQEIATAVGYGASFVVIVVDNGVYATIREHQEHHYPGRPSGTHLTNPDFAALARSFGGYGETVSTTADFRAALLRARESGGPAVLHLRQDPAVRSPSAS